MSKTWEWFAALFVVAVVGWRGQAWWRARTKRAIKVDAVSAHWVAQQRGRNSST